MISDFALSVHIFIHSGKYPADLYPWGKGWGGMRIFKTHYFKWFGNLLAKKILFINDNAHPPPDKSSQGGHVGRQSRSHSSGLALRRLIPAMSLTSVRPGQFSFWTFLIPLNMSWQVHLHPPCSCPLQIPSRYQGTVTPRKWQASVRYAASPTK